MTENWDGSDKDKIADIVLDFQPTRRAVLAGATAVAVSSSARAAYAPSRHYHLDFLNKIRRQVVVLTAVEAERDQDPAKRLVDPGNNTKLVVTDPSDPKFLLSWDRREFGRNASFRIERRSEKYYPDGEPDPKKPSDARAPAWTPVEWILHVDRASFPGREDKEFSARFSFARLDVYGDWAVSATITEWWNNSRQIATLLPVSLEDFIEGPNKARLGFKIDRPDGMLRSLFGDRIETTAPVVLSMDRNLVWAIDAAVRVSLPGDAAPALPQKRKGRLFILDIPLEFGGLKLTRIRSDRAFADDQRAAAPEGETQGSSGGGTVAAKDQPAAKTPPPQANKERRLFETEVIYGRPAKLGERSGEAGPDGLYGTIHNISGFTEPNKDPRDPENVVQRWHFDFAAKRLPQGDAAVGVVLDAPAFTRDPTGVRQHTEIEAAIRHWGYPDHTVAGCFVAPVNDSRSIGRLKLRHGAPRKIEEGPFEFSGFEIVRQRRAQEDAVITRLTVQPVAKDTDVDLQLGSICVAALPAVSAKPGIFPSVPPIVVEATEKPKADDKNRRELKAFHGRLSLGYAVISLPERIVPATKEKAEYLVPGRHIARLSFEEADALIYLPLLGSAPTSSADAVVPIGPPGSGVSNALFDFGRARLSILRPDDLLALKYRFSGLELLVPWPPAHGKAAELRPRGGRSTGRPFVKTGSRSAASRDERPLLVVEFPPQHVVERAYFRQLPATPELPELNENSEPNRSKLIELKRALAAPKQWKWEGLARGETSLAERWKTLVIDLLEKCGVKPGETGETSRDLRINMRKQIQDCADWTKPLFANSAAKTPMTVRRFEEDFRSQLDNAFKNRPDKMPEEQRLYVGADFLDPDARRIANDVIRKLKQEEDRAINPALAPQNDRLLSANELDEVDWKATFKPFVNEEKEIPSAKEQGTWPSLATVKDKKSEKLVKAVELARELRDRDYAAFRTLYRQSARENTGPDKSNPPEDYFGPQWFEEVLAEAPEPRKSKLVEFKKYLLTPEPFPAAVPARLSGPSRIAFRIDSDDYEPDRAAGRIPFTLEGLTNWGGMDMSVVRRAERLMDPLQGTRLPPRWGRRAVNDEGKILRFQGFTSSERWSRKPEGYRREPAGAAVTARQRLAEVYGSTENEPDLFETAIELPFRLFLSPAQDATWVTAAPRVRRDAGLHDDVDTFRELWTARLSGQGESAGVRAVWSPDYRPEALLSTDAPGAPAMGAYAPWALPRTFGLRRIPSDNVEQFRTGLEAFDRHELVILTSVHGLPVLGRRAQSGDLASDSDQIEPPEGFRLQGILPERHGNQDVDMSAIYRPKPLSVKELSLSALGGNLDIDVGFQPPAPAQDKETKQNLFDALSVDRWRQRTVLGRDIVVEVIYKGFLFPFGHRASLVKLTERRFESVNGLPAAILVQRLFLRVAKPDKRFQAEGQPNRASRWPCERINILTRQTPDLVDARSENPRDDDPAFLTMVDRKEEYLVTARGKIVLKKDKKARTTGLCLWPRTAPREGAEVWFEMQIGDEAVPVRLPLIFVDNIAANDKDTMAALVEYYNRVVKHDASVSPTRRLLRNGQPVVMAPEYKVGDTTFETEWWRVAAEGREQNFPTRDTSAQTIKIDNTLYTRDSFMEGQDQPPFYPMVERARCRLKPVERFTGSGPLWADVAFDGNYVADGFTADGEQPREEQSEIYLRILPSDAKPKEDTVELDFAERGDLGGGVARPKMDIVALSRQLGPINGGEKGKPTGSGANNVTDSPPPSPEKAQTAELPTLDRVRRFSDSVNIIPKGKFLGIMELKDLVELFLGVKLHPKLTEVIEYGAASLQDAAGGAVGAAAGAVASAASEVRSALTKSIIVPAFDAVVDVRKAWEAIATKRLWPEGTPQPAAEDIPTLAKIYPQIGTDIKALEDLLRNVQSPALSDADFFSRLSAVHEAARRLIRSIEAITRDPLAAAAGSQVELFRRLFAPIDEIRKAIDAVDTLRQLAQQLPTKIANVLGKIILEELARDVTGVDLVHAALENVVKESLPADKVWRIETVIGLPRKLDDQLKIEIGKLAAGSDAQKALIQIEEKVGPLADDVEKATSDIKNVKEELEKLVSSEIVRADQNLASLVARQKKQVEEAERRAIELVMAALLSRPVAAALRTAADAQEVWQAIPAPPLDEEKLRKFLDALARALSPILDVNKAKLAVGLFAADFCTKIQSALSSVLSAVLPPLDSAANQLKFSVDEACLKELLDKKKLPASCSPGTTVKNLYDLAVKAKEALRGVSETKATEFDQAAAAALAGILRLVRDYTAARTAIGALAAPPGAPGAPPAVCSVPSALPKALRDLAVSHRLMIAAMRSFLETSRAISETYLLPAIVNNVNPAPFKTAFDALIKSLRPVLEELPQLTVYSAVMNAAQFKSTLETVADAIASTFPRSADKIRDLANKPFDTSERRKKFEEAVQAVTDRTTALIGSPTPDAHRTALQEALEAAKRELLLTGEVARGRLEDAFAADLYNIVADTVTQANALIDEFDAVLNAVGGGVFQVLWKAYDAVIKGQTALTQLVEDQKKTPVIKKLLDTLARGIGAGVGEKLFEVYPPEDTERKPENELLRREKEFAQAIATNWGAAKDSPARRLAVQKLNDLLEAWKDPALVRLFRRFAELRKFSLRALIVEALDLRAMRRELERIVRELVPSKASLSYDFATPVREFSLPGVGKVFLPVPGTRLDIKMRASVDLLDPKPPEARIDGHLGPFGIQLFGNLDVVILNFRGLDFRAGGGRPSGFDVRFGDFVIGSKAKFLKQLEPYVSPKAGPPPVRFMRDKPGIEATYGINLGSFGVGTLSFSNVTLNAGARLPFGAKEEAEFLISIGRSDAPFLISSTIFGGGGYLALLANGKGFIGLETSFDYGGVFTFGFGPLSGTGQITLGMYFRAARGEPSRLGMNFMARGAANIACFSISTSLFVRLTYAGGKMDGQATYTFSFSMGIHDVEFRIDVYVNQGGNAGSGSPTGFLNLPGMPATRFAQAGPQLITRDVALQSGGKKETEKPTPTLRVDAPSQRTKWKEYRALFNDSDPVVKI